METDRNQVVLAAPGALAQAAGKTTTDESELKLSESRPRPGGGAICDHSGDTQTPGDNAMLSSRNGFSLTLSGLSFSDRIVIDVCLNGER